MYEEDQEYEDTDLDYNEEVDSESELLDKLAGILDNEDEPVSESTPEPEQPQPVESPQAIPDDYKVKVKINGIEQEVPLSELRNGYQRQADYTAKTQELSQQRGEVEAAKSQYEQYVQSIPMLAVVAQQNVEKAMSVLYSQELAELAQNDPAEYVAKKAQIELSIAENQKAYQQMQQQYSEYQVAATKQREQLLSETLTRANELLNEQVEGWKDGSTRKVLVDYALNGAELTEADLNNLYDHRYIKILNKARMYDELMSRQNVAQKRVEKVPPKVVNPGNQVSTQEDELKAARQKAIKKAQRGDDSDLLDILSRML